MTCHQSATAAAAVPALAGDRYHGGENSMTPLTVAVFGGWPYNRNLLAKQNRYLSFAYPA